VRRLALFVRVLRKIPIRACLVIICLIVFGMEWHFEVVVVGLLFADRIDRRDSLCARDLGLRGLK
jgi:hypothetical protein